jgi:hypothetical protein
MTAEELRLKTVMDAAIALGRLADEMDVIVTIEQISHPPYAMGRYKTIATVRPARVP